MQYPALLIHKFSKYMNHKELGKIPTVGGSKIYCGFDQIYLNMACDPLSQVGHLVLD